MKAKVTIKKFKIAEGYEFFNGRNAIAKITRNDLGKWFFEAPGFWDCDLSLLIVKASGVEYLRRKFRELGFDDVEFIADFETTCELNDPKK